MISQALARAREIRLENDRKIVVHVAPGEYVDDFPLYVNLSNIELQGSTELLEDHRSLPRNCGSDIDQVPCVESNTETLIIPPTPLQVGHSLVIAAPARDSQADMLTDVTITGFVFDARGGTSIFVDRVDGFLIDHNVIRNGAPGLSTRFASGRIASNFVYRNNQGIVVGGGSEILPALVALFDNRSVSNVIGAAALGTALFLFANEDPNIKEIQNTFDPTEHPEQVPDKLSICMIGNDISFNTSFGVRLEQFPAGDLFYITTDNQPMTAHIAATVRDNSISSNGEYGVLIEGGFNTRTNPRTFTGVFNGSFRANDLSNDGRAGLFVGFMLNGVVTRNPGLINQYKYALNSEFTLRVDREGEAFGIDYDNPYFDPFDHVTPLNNTLTINRDTVTGTHVTCPPGFPCVM
jgi:hypothetical protein